MKTTMLSTLRCPAALVSVPAWLMWRYEAKPGRDKPLKVPYYVNGRKRHGVQGSKEDRAQLATFEAAREAAIKRGMDGVGFCPLDGAGLTVIDLDDCAGPDGALHPDAERLVAGTYAEYSPSGGGAHAFFVGEGLGNGKDAHGEPFGLEVFSTKGFLTFTGRALPITELTDSCNTIADVTPELRDYCAARLGRTAAAVPAVSGESAPLGLTLEQLREALDVLDPSMSRDSWLKVLMVLHHETGGSQDGLALADEWSSRGVQYQGLEDVQGRWDSFGRGGQRPVTGYWLVRLANDNGARIEIAHVEAADDFEVLPQEPKADPEPVRISFVDFASLLHTLPPPREWVVDQWLPRKTVTLMSGRGGHGKSLLAQQLAACVANGQHFLDRRVQQGPVLGLFAEDDADELLRRAAALYGALGLDVGAGSERLHLDARAGKFNTLIAFTTDHKARPTKLMTALREQVLRLRPALVILDNIAQLYAGPENDRHDVTAFCNALTAIAGEGNTAVLLLGHVAKVEDSEYSGSTAWDAAVRSRLLLARQDDGTTLLRKAKANYSALDEMRLEYRAGAFALLPTASQVGPEVIEGVKPLIVRALEVFTKRCQATSHLTTARNYLVRLMVADGALAGSVRADLLQAGLRAMLDAGEIDPVAVLPWKSPSRHAVTGLAIKEAAE